MALTRRRMLTGLPCLPLGLPLGLPLVGCATAGAPAVEVVRASPLLVRATPPWRRGLGELDDVDPALRVAFSDAQGFAPLPAPGPRGWRVLQPEAAQTVAEFRASAPNTRTAPRDRIALLPLGEFPFEVVVDRSFVGMVRAPELPAIARLLTAFFATPVDVLPRERLPEPLLPRRIVAGHSQYDARALLDVVDVRLPRDAHSMLTLVNVDLYVLPEQDYAFGWSTLRDRLGVVGFSRLDPGYAPGDPAGTLLRRGLALCVHEVGHMFGLGHCQQFRCAMNGIADHAELDATPLRLCPLCLRKLHIVTELDPRARDERLLEVFTALAIADEASWLAERADRLWHRGHA